jgi:hypothetical protein
MYLAIALKNWKFIVMAALAIALAFSVTSCTGKSHQIDLLESQKTLAETQRDLARSESATASLETEKVWAHQLLESEQNANKNLQVALAAASDSALAVDRLSKQISDTTNVCPQVPIKPSLNTPRPAIPYSKQWQTVVEQSQSQLMNTQLMQKD